MRVSIMQPAFLPWLGFFDRLLTSDLLIVLDHVQIDMNSKTKFVNRNRIRTATGWIWLTVPLLTKGLSDLAINKLRILEDSPWRKKMWRAIEASYSQSPFFATYAETVSAALDQPIDNIANLDRVLTDALLARMEIELPVMYSSAMPIGGVKDDLLISLCSDVGATSYISGPFGRDYIDRTKFEDAGIGLMFHDYEHPRYEQAFPGFEPYMSMIDLLFNHGPKSKDILVTGRTLSPK